MFALTLFLAVAASLAAQSPAAWPDSANPAAQITTNHAVIDAIAKQAQELSYAMPGYATTARAELSHRIACALQDERVMAIARVRVTLGQSVVDEERNAARVGERQGDVESRVLVPTYGRPHPVENVSAAFVESALSEAAGPLPKMRREDVQDTVSARGVVRSGPHRRAVRSAGAVGKSDTAAGALRAQPAHAVVDGAWSPGRQPSEPVFRYRARSSSMARAKV